MIKYTLPVLFILLSACGGRYGQGLPTTKSDATAYLQAQAAEITPSSQMQSFAPMVGTFDFQMGFTFYPDADPMTFGGTCEFKEAFGGSWLIGNWYPGNAGSPSIGMTLLGYSTTRKRYIFGAIDDKGVAPSGEGVEVNIAGARFAVEYEMTMKNVMESTRPIIFKRRMEIIDENTIRGTDYRSGWNGKLVPFATLQMNRKKS